MNRVRKNKFFQAVSGQGKLEPDAGPIVTMDGQTGLPLIQCKQTASLLEELTPERVADLLLTQETDWHHAAGGSQ